jgi:hypothetical protein
MFLKSIVSILTIIVLTIDFKINNTNINDYFTDMLPHHSYKWNTHNFKT